MSRSRIELEVKQLKTPRERVWQVLLQLGSNEGEHFNKTAVQDRCNPMVSWSLVDDYCDALEKAGYLVRVGGNGSAQGVMGMPIEFVLQRQQLNAPRLNAKGIHVRQGGGTEAMWRAMKVLSSFDYIDIANATNLGTLVVKASTAKVYVAHLARVGYLATVRAAKPGTPARHRLINNTGPIAPAITRTKAVFDRNTGEIAKR